MPTLVESLTQLCPEIVWLEAVSSLRSTRTPSCKVNHFKPPVQFAASWLGEGKKTRQTFNLIVLHDRRHDSS